MRVIHVSDVTKFGGIETLVEQLSSFQTTNQYLEVTILSPFKNNPNKIIKIDSKVNIVYGNLNSGFDFRISKLLIIYKLMKEHDLIHFHGFNIFLIFCAMAARKKIVYTEHGTFQKVNQKISCRKYINSRVFGYFFLNNFVSKVVFNSNWLKNNVQLKSKNVCVILNGALPTYNVEGIRKDENNIFDVLIAARFVIRKRIDRLIKAFSYLQNNQDYYLHLVGDGLLSQKLQQQANSLLKKGTYCFYGYQTDMSMFYKKADLFVLPTEFEPFGLVVLEAMYAKIPVICFNDGGGALEIIENVHPKLIVKDEEELAGTIEFWKNHEEERRHIGEVLFKLAKLKFSLERMASDYLNVYKEVLENIN